jgi:dTDP-4-dehydrorhamnose reductase
MNILVTGSHGQLGSELGKIANTDRKHQWFFTDIDTLDITNDTQVRHFFGMNQIEICINCAAYTAVDKAEDEPDKAMLVNSTAPSILAGACEAHDALLIHISTDYVFNGEHFKPYEEDDAIAAVSAYGLSKAKGETLIQESKANYVIIRTSWLYSAVGNNFVKTMLRLGAERDQLTVIVDQVGTPTWAFDLAATIVVIADRYQKESVHSIYHFSNEGAISWYDFAKTIMQIANLNCKILPIESKDYPVKTKRPFYSVLNKTRIKNELGIQIPYWRDSLIKCVEEINGKKQA